MSELVLGPKKTLEKLPYDLKVLYKSFLDGEWKIQKDGYHCGSINGLFAIIATYQIQIDNLADYILTLDCGLPIQDAEHPAGMGAVEAAIVYIKRLRGVVEPEKLIDDLFVIIEDVIPRIIRNEADQSHARGELKACIGAFIRKGKREGDKG